MHIPSLVNLHWDLPKLLSWKQNTDVRQADYSVQTGRNLPIGNPKSDLYTINGHIKFGENPLMFT